MIEASLTRYRRNRFPAEIIARAVRLYYRFPLSLRDVEGLLAERCIDISFQTISKWVAKFGCKCAHQPRRLSRDHILPA
jgi:putative transposase